MKGEGLRSTGGNLLLSFPHWEHAPFIWACAEDRTKEMLTHHNVTYINNDDIAIRVAHACMQ